MIRVHDIVKSFDEEHIVLNHISADFHDGKVNMIIGQSGSGKTVLMKSMIGLYPINSGEIVYDVTYPTPSQRDISGMRDKEIRMLHREVGMLFQGAALFDSLSVIDNVRFPLEMFGHGTDEEYEDRAVTCLKRVNMPEHAFKLMPAEISGGMQKRVAIARAIVLQPKYLFCDEPNSGLDPKTSLVIDQLIHEITVESNICTIVNSHDMNSIMEIGDNIIFLKNGVKEWQGSNTEIFHSNSEALEDFVFASDLFKKVKATNSSL